MKIFCVRHWVLALLILCISFSEMASEELFTNFNTAPSFFFNSSSLTSIFFLKEHHFLSLHLQI